MRRFRLHLCSIARFNKAKHHRVGPRDFPLDTAPMQALFGLVFHPTLEYHRRALPCHNCNLLVTLAPCPPDKAQHAQKSVHVILDVSKAGPSKAEALAVCARVANSVAQTFELYLQEEDS